jgi:hypothetical protein
MSSRIAHPPRLSLGRLHGLKTRLKTDDKGFMAVLAIFPICEECNVDREVHVTAGQEAGATVHSTTGLRQRGDSLNTNM